MSSTADMESNSDPAASPPAAMSRVRGYRLSEEQSLHIFDRTIQPAEFKGLPTSPSSPPLVVIVAGQTGAGKSTLSPWILDAFRANGRTPAHLIADVYKAYHPLYRQLLDTDPELASPATSYDARRWLAMAAREAARRRVDVFLESACREPRDFTELAQVFRDPGYRIEVLLLAVPAPMSRLGLLMRYYKRQPQAQPSILPIRLTPVAIHDASYTGLLDVALHLDQTGLADQVLVVRRGNLAAFSQQEGQHEPDSKPRIAEALSLERTRQLTLEELDKTMGDIQYLLGYRQCRDDLCDITELLSELGSKARSNRKTQDGDKGDDRAEDQDVLPQLFPLEFARSPPNSPDGQLGPHVLRMGHI